MINLDEVLKIINTAVTAVNSANVILDQIKDSKVVLEEDDQAQVDAAIAQLRSEYDDLHAKVQDKLRGTSG